MMKFWNQRIQDTTWGQYIMLFVVVYGAMIGWLYKDTIVEKLEETKEKIPHRKYTKVEDDDFLE